MQVAKRPRMASDLLGLFDESHGHGVAVELAFVGGDGGLDHADDAEDIEEDGEDDEADATGDESEREDEEGVDDEGDLEVECFAPVIVEEGGFIFFDVPHDERSDDGNSPEHDMPHEGEVEKEGEGSFVGGGIGVVGAASLIDGGLAVLCVLLVVFVVHNPLSRSGASPQGVIGEMNRGISGGGNRQWGEKKEKAPSVTLGVPPPLEARGRREEG